MSPDIIPIVFFGGSRFSEQYLKTLQETEKYEVFPFRKLPLAEEVKKLRPKIGVIAYFGQIVPKEILEIPEKGFINVHYSLLPRWRGAAPVQAAILAGDKETGVTIIIASEKVDAGPILAQAQISIEKTDTYLSLEKKLIALGSRLLLETLPKYFQSEIKPKVQDEALATYSQKTKTEDGRIDWSKSAEEIMRQIRAINPEPGTYAFFNKKRLLILEARAENATHNHKPGEVIKSESSFKIACKNGFVIPLRIKLEGKKELLAEAFLHGQRDFIGKILN